MEDILASIRRIIAEDQSNSLGRSGIGGLTRRQMAPAPVAAAEAPEAEPVFEDNAALVATPEAEGHAGPQADPLHRAYEAPLAETHASLEIAAGEPETAPLVDADYELQADDAAQGHDVGAPDSPVLAIADDVEPLMSAATGASITSSFQTLAESVMLQDPGLIERVMRDSMRPLLKAWLDDHLPSIVERLVRTEIERVARGGRARNV